MGEYRVIGGNRIIGETTISGGKNAILPILASVVLNNGKSIIHNCPRISDTFISIEILESIGCKVSYDGGTLVVDSSTANSFSVPERLVREMRSSIIFLGGILGRFKKVIISYPGGCELGARPIGLHLKALREMGVSIVEEHGFIICEVEKIIGKRIYLDFPSVGATENIMLAAVFAEGETIISNAAKEPEIVELQNFLNRMGAKIKGAGTDSIVISGVKKLHDVEFSVMPDRIVAGTYLIAAAITGGEIVLKDIIHEHIYPIVTRLAETGCIIKEYDNNIYLKAPQIIKPLSSIRTGVHPGFPTDCQPQLMTYLTLADGTTVFTETVFESRYKHVGELIRMGADIVMTQEGTTFIIKGVKRLKSSVVEAKDLRGGAALILAGLAAEGETVVLNSKHVERGYVKIEEDLRQLGACIRFVP